MPLEHYQQAIDIYRRAYGSSDHGDIALVYKNMGDIYLEQSKPEMAREAFEQDLQIQRRIGRSSHPNIAAAHYDLANADLAVGDLASSQRQLAIALKQYKSIYPHTHPVILRCHLLQAEIYTAEDNPREALKLCDQVLRGK